MEYKVLILDLDGTVYTDGKPIQNIIAQLNAFKAEGNRVYYLSNNTSVSVSHYLQKLTKLGLDVDISEIITPTIIAARYLKSHYRRGYIVGTRSFIGELEQEYGIMNDETDPEFVLLSFDRELTYEKLMLASRFLNQGLPFLITHIDLACPSAYGPIPDCGSISLLMEAVTRRKPELHFGKPSDQMIEYIASLIEGVDRSEVLMGGDRLYTDILLGNKLGLKTLLVLSGESKLDDYRKNTQFEVTHCAYTLSEFLEGKELNQLAHDL